jgi:hypothetical protein
MMVELIAKAIEAVIANGGKFPLVIEERKDGVGFVVMELGKRTPSAIIHKRGDDPAS